MIRHQTLHLAIVTRKETMRFFFSDYDLSCRESFTVALSHRIKKRKLLTPGVNLQLADTKAS